MKSDNATKLWKKTLGVSLDVSTDLIELCNICVLWNSMFILMSVIMSNRTDCQSQKNNDKLQFYLDTFISFFHLFLVSEPVFLSGY